MEPTPRSTRWLVVFVAICVVFAGLGGFLAYRFVSNSGTPTEWDPKVRSIVTFVENETKLTFVHPVRIKFLASAEFNKRVTKDETSLSDKERAAIADDEAVGRAFGWYTGTTDLLKEQNTLNSSGILAYYDFGSRQIVARAEDPAATTLSVPLRTTIAHELVHAMQDQRLKIRSLQNKAKGSEASSALTALFEGHAVYVEGRYLASLPAAEQEAYFDEVGKMTGDIQENTKDVARVTAAALEAPYVIGPSLVAAAAVSKAGVDQLFVRPPVALDQVLDPTAYFAQDAPESVDAPKPEGTRVDSGTLGIVRLYLTLAAAIGAEDAWKAASGWGNDSFVAARSTKDAPVCVHWVLVADNAEATQTLRDALTRWASSRVKEASAGAEEHGGTIDVRFCDPGKAITQPLLGQEPIDFFYTRANLLEALIENTGSLGVAVCATESVMRNESIETLQNPDDAVRARVAAAVAACPRT